MGSEADDELLCAICCFELSSSPEDNLPFRLNPCGHTFCLSCARAMESGKASARGRRECSFCKTAVDSISRDEDLFERVKNVVAGPRDAASSCDAPTGSDTAAQSGRSDATWTPGAPVIVHSVRFLMGEEGADAGPLGIGDVGVVVGGEAGGGAQPQQQGVGGGGDGPETGRGGAGGGDAGGPGPAGSGRVLVRVRGAERTQVVHSYDRSALAPQPGPGSAVTAANAIPGLRVRRGPDWRWGEQDHGGVGILVGPDGQEGRKWWAVRWSDGTMGTYRIDGAADLVYASQAAASPPTSPSDSHRAAGSLGGGGHAGSDAGPRDRFSPSLLGSCGEAPAAVSSSLRAQAAGPTGFELPPLPPGRPAMLTSAVELIPKAARFSFGIGEPIEVLESDRPSGNRYRVRRSAAAGPRGFSAPPSPPAQAPAPASASHPPPPLAAGAASSPTPATPTLPPLPSLPSLPPANAADPAHPVPPPPPPTGTMDLPRVALVPFPLPGDAVTEETARPGLRVVRGQEGPWRPEDPNDKGTLLWECSEGAGPSLWAVVWDSCPSVVQTCHVGSLGPAAARRDLRFASPVSAPPSRLFASLEACRGGAGSLEEYCLARVRGVVVPSDARGVARPGQKLYGVGPVRPGEPVVVLTGSGTLHAFSADKLVRYPRPGDPVALEVAQRGFRVVRAPQTQQKEGGEGSGGTGTIESVSAEGRVTVRWDSTGPTQSPRSYHLSSGSFPALLFADPVAPPDKHSVIRPAQTGGASKKAVKSPGQAPGKAGRFRVGDRVVLSTRHARAGDAALGPLRPGEPGVVVSDEAAQAAPYNVRASDGRTWFYRAAALEPYPVAGDPVTAAVAHPGLRVVRGPAWRWGDQDGGAGRVGRILGSPEAGWLKIQWLADGPSSAGPSQADRQHAWFHVYRCTEDGIADLAFADPPSPAGSLSTELEAIAALEGPSHSLHMYPPSHASDPGRPPSLAGGPTGLATGSTGGGAARGGSNQSQYASAAPLATGSVPQPLSEPRVKAPHEREPVTAGKDGGSGATGGTGTSSSAPAPPATAPGRLAVPGMRGPHTSLSPSRPPMQTSQGSASAGANGHASSPRASLPHHDTVFAAGPLAGGAGFGDPEPSPAGLIASLTPLTARLDPSTPFPMGSGQTKSPTPQDPQVASGSGVAHVTGSSALASARVGKDSVMPPAPPILASLERLGPDVGHASATNGTPAATPQLQAQPERRRQGGRDQASGAAADSPRPSALNSSAQPLPLACTWSESARGPSLQEVLLAEFEPIVL